MNIKKNDIGIIGMAVMGRNLALNIANHNYNVSIFNRTAQKTEDIVNNYHHEKIFPYFNINDFIKSLNSPKCILLMVQSGATSDIIQSIIPYLNSNDIIIDGGNSFYKDTIVRYHELLKKNINFIGMGISGGEYGALKGPSMMPGGDKESYNIVKPILKDISAKFCSEPCIKYIGSDGSGHYVKMIHNGIEYAEMQLIADAYFILKTILKLNNQEISKVFKEWNDGELNSYLLTITTKILIKQDHQGYLIDFILDQASNKGTGKWTCQDALELSEPLNIITESVFSRYLSSLKSQRVLASNLLDSPKINFITNFKSDFIEKVRQSLYLGKILCYCQGFSQLSQASDKYYWKLKYYDIAKIFRSGCIIASSLLNDIVEIYKYDSTVMNLLLTPTFQNIANQYQYSLREVVSYCINQGISIPALSSSIIYFDGYRTKNSSANLIQAQRDYFGAHNYKRIDQMGVYHTDWL